MKKLIALLLTVALVASLSLAGAITFTEKTIEVKGGATIYLEDAILHPTDVNGKPVDTFIYEGTTYLPVRAVSETLGMDVDFDLETGSVYVDDMVGDAEKADEYLAYYFDIVLEDEVTLEAWNTAIVAVGGTALETETLTTGDAIVSALEAAGLKALVDTYTTEKAVARLAAYGVPHEVSEEDAVYLAAALDAELITAITNPTAALDAETAEELLMGVVQTSGKGRNYIGRVSDADILSKVITAVNEITLVDDGGLLAELGPEIVYRNATTGYNLKYTGYNANFLPAYTLQYGHSSAAHAAQLITILVSEGIDAYIQIEPKTSIYEWEGLQYDNEYDMQIEFDTVEDRLAFDGIVKEYAQKFIETQNEDGSFTGLIDGAWWTPLYSSTEPIDDENYGVGYDNIIKNGEYEIHSFSTADAIDDVAAVVADVTPELEVVVVERYINTAFVDEYLPTGETVLEGAAE